MKNKFTNNIEPFVTPEYKLAKVARKGLNHQLKFPQLKNAHALPWSEIYLKYQHIKDTHN